jgi:hypothetical protein
MNKSVGDAVIVKDNLYFHCFKIGQELTVSEVRPKCGDYLVTDGKTFQALTDEELG